MRKLVLTKIKKNTIAVLFEEWDGKEKAIAARIFLEEESSYIGNIYIGHVRDVVKNIEACFVEIAKDTLGYMVLKQPQPVFLNPRKNTDKICEGDSVIVQVTRDAIKSKDMALTTSFSLTGRYVVLTHGKSGIVFSSKIKDVHYKKDMLEELGHFLDEEGITPGILLRTEAERATNEQIKEEIRSLYQEYCTLLKTASTRQKHYCLKKAESEFLRFLKDVVKDGQDCELITDSEAYLLEAQPICQQYENLSIKFYQDNLLALYKLYQFESVFDEIYAKKIWLKSGAYLVIEYTEALTVIDVNSGKCEKGKQKEQTFAKINQEAALEIARQIRLRNISGIILVDFIDVANEQTTKDLMDYTRALLKKDTIKTSLVDMTKLHLMEITRKKTIDRIPYVPDLFELS